MDRRALWISAAATLLGALSLWLYIRRFEREATGGPTTRVLVLKRDSREGAVVQRELLAERALPEAYLESRHIKARDTERILGAKLGVEARAGEALLWTDLATMRERGRQLSSLVPEGMRAIAIDPGAAGFEALLRPGDRVDALSTVRHASAPDGAQAVPVGQNLLVLAVGDDVGGVQAQRAAHDARSVSLAVTPEQAALLAEAELRGPLRLVLRNADDLDLRHAAPRTRVEGGGADLELP